MLSAMPIRFSVYTATLEFVFGHSHMLKRHLTARAFLEPFTSLRPFDYLLIFMLSRFAFPHRAT